MRLTEINKKDQKVIDSEITAGAQIIGADEFGHPNKKPLFPKLGLCNDCAHLHAMETKWGKIYAMCTEFEMKLRQDDEVCNCTRYSTAGQMSIWDMKEIAIILEPNRKIAGFVQKE